MTAPRPARTAENGRAPFRPYRYTPSAGKPSAASTAEPVYAALSAAVSRLREEQGLNRFELARLAGIDTHAVAKVEEGTAGVTMSTAAKIYGALGLDLAAMITPPVKHQARSTDTLTDNEVTRTEDVA